jgi:hypothetical protein
LEESLKPLNKLQISQNHIVPKPACWIVACVFAGCFGWGWQPLALAQSPPEVEPAPASTLPSPMTGLKAAGDASKAGAASSHDGAGQGNRWLVEAAQQLRAYSTISGRIRHQVHLFGHRLVGTGAYYQLNRDDGSLIRMELKTPVGEDVSSLVQVADGRFLWTHQVMPAVNPQAPPQVEVNRIDLDALRRLDRRESTSPTQHLLLEGLPYLLNQLAAYYQFESPQTIKLHSIPGFGLIGVRRKLPSIVEDGEAQRGEAQRGEVALMSDRVRIVLGREDLFPFLFEFQDAQSQPMLILEFFEVQLGGDVDPLMFVFKPRGLPVSDITREHVEMVRTSRERRGRLVNRRAESAL